MKIRGMRWCRLFILLKEIALGELLGSLWCMLFVFCVGLKLKIATKWEKCEVFFCSRFWQYALIFNTWKFILQIYRVTFHWWINISSIFMQEYIPKNQQRFPISYASKNVLNNWFYLNFFGKLFLYKSCLSIMYWFNYWHRMPRIK